MACLVNRSKSQVAERFGYSCGLPIGGVGVPDAPVANALREKTGLSRPVQVLHHPQITDEVTDPAENRQSAWFIAQTEGGKWAGALVFANID